MKPLRPHINELLQSGCILSSGSNEFWVGWGKSIKGSRPAVGLSSGEISLYTPDFFLKDPGPWSIFPCSCKLTRAELSTLLSGAPKCPDLSIEWKEAELQEFRLAFLDLQQKFEGGTLRKAVPIVIEEGELRDTQNPSDPILSDSVLKYRAQLLFHLLRSTQDFPLYIYGVWDQGEGILGATPEILFEQTEPRRLSTVAIAGTRSRTPLGSHPPSLIDDPKELEEHRIVIEGICNSLTELGDVKVGTTRELELPTLVHLRTPVTLTFRDSEFNFETVARRLHPTPALGAFPKEPGRVWLENYPLNRNRKRFGAPFGATWGTGESLCVVAIRNIQWQGAKYMIGAGCGVVPASQLEKECDELRAKIRSVKKSFVIL
ncbi:MAG: chorismate-binding protein [Bdellovibrionia bacterium]